MRSSARWCALIFFATAFAVRAEDVGARHWLERFVHGMSELNYRGVLSYERGEHLESLRVTHAMIGGEAFERLEHLDGEHREVIRRGEQLYCIQLGQHLNTLLHKPVLKTGLAGLDPYYDVQTGSEGRVAGRRSIDISIKPRDAYRFGYRLALDSETGLLLRSEALDANGRVLERLQFVDIEIAKTVKPEWLRDVDLAAPQKSADGRTIERVIEETQMPWRPQWLPPGFVLALAPHRPSDDVLTYSDGLAVVSIFVAPGEANMLAGAGRAQQGATMVFTRQASFGGAPFNITAIGEVPLATAQRVAESVAWSGAP